MTRLLLCSAIVLTVAWTMPSSAAADHLVLTNGDTLTGTIVSQSATNVVFETALAGRVTVRRAAIASLTPSVEKASAPVTTEAAGPTWHGVANAGVDASRGNSPTATVTTNTAVTRVGALDKLGVFGAYLYSKNGAGDAATTNVRAARGGARYDHDVAGPLFGFGFGDLENDALQLLKLRTVFGGGAGLHVVKNDATQLNVVGGASFAHDAYTSETTSTTPTPTTTPSGSNGPSPNASGRGLATAPGLSKSGRNGTPPAVVRTSLSRDVGEVMIGQDLWRQVNTAVSVTEQFGFFPALGDVQDYRVSFDFALGVQLNGWLQWNLTVADRYLHIPPAGGAVQNDAFLSTGLGITFGGGASGAYTGTEGRRAAR